MRGFLSLSSITLVDNKNQYSYTRNRFLFSQAVQLNCVDFQERVLSRAIHILCAFTRGLLAVASRKVPLLKPFLAALG